MFMDDPPDVNCRAKYYSAADHLINPIFCFNTPMAGPRRELKLPYREMSITCPHCRTPLTVGTVMARILLSRRTCPKCGKEFLIENDVPRKPDGGLKKPSGSVKPVRAVKRTKSR